MWLGWPPSHWLTLIGTVLQLGGLIAVGVQLERRAAGRGVLARTASALRTFRAYTVLGYLPRGMKRVVGISSSALAMIVTKGRGLVGPSPGADIPDRVQALEQALKSLHAEVGAVQNRLDEIPGELDDTIRANVQPVVDAQRALGNEIAELRTGDLGVAYAGLFVTAFGVALVLLAFWLEQYHQL